MLGVGFRTAIRMFFLGGHEVLLYKFHEQTIKINEKDDIQNRKKI